MKSCKLEMKISPLVSYEFFKDEFWWGCVSII